MARIPSRNAITAVLLSWYRCGHVEPGAPSYVYDVSVPFEVRVTKIRNALKKQLKTKTPKRPKRKSEDYGIDFSPPLTYENIRDAPYGSIKTHVVLKDAETPEPDNEFLVMTARNKEFIQRLVEEIDKMGL